MNAARWHKTRYPDKLLFHLRGQASDRKLRLFACACCRRGWHLLTDPRSRAAVELSELLADGRASEEALEEAQRAAREAARGLFGSDIAAIRAQAAADAAFHPDSSIVGTGGIGPTWSVAGRDFYPKQAAKNIVSALATLDPLRARAEMRAQADLLRDIMGNPFQPVEIDPAWLKWHDAAVVRLAERIHAERRYADLPILADALEEAGCADSTILDHARAPAVHVPGCWLVDRLLGKQ